MTIRPSGSRNETRLTLKAMNQNQTASNSLHPPVIAGVSRVGRVGGFFFTMNPSPELKKSIRDAELSCAGNLRLAARESDDDDLRALLDGSANLIDSMSKQVVKSLEAFAMERARNQKGADVA